MENFILELCCASAEDAIAAEQGGSRRIELNSDLFHGGITPSLGTLQTIKSLCPGLSVMCMVRPREGGFCYSAVEYEVMKRDARAFLDNGADGIVFGFLHENGTVNSERTREMRMLAGEKEAVFHRAIDVTPNVYEALDALMDCGITRVLTSGQKPTVSEGLTTIRSMMEYVGNRLQILPGGGISQDNIEMVRTALNAKQLHVATHRVRYDLSTAANQSIYYGGAIYPPEDRHALAHAEDVALLVQNALGK